MPITLREKEHWKHRITRKIDQAIEAAYSKEKPTFLEDIRKQAKVRAMESLGIAKLDAKLASLEAQKKQLADEADGLRREQYALVTGKSVTEVGDYYAAHSITNAIDRRAKVHEKELLAETDLGRRVLKLEQEKEELLDTVWLATSTTQIKQLWQTVADVLQQEPTPLQKEALRIEPTKDAME